MRVCLANDVELTLVERPSQSGQNVAGTHCFSLRYSLFQEVPAASKLLVADLDVVSLFLRTYAFAPSKIQIVRCFPIKFLTSSDILSLVFNLHDA